VLWVSVVVWCPSLVVVVVRVDSEELWAYDGIIRAEANKDVSISVFMVSSPS
jgi:hypothetical protein